MLTRWSGCRVQGAGCRVQGARCRGEGAGGKAEASHRCTLHHAPCTLHLAPCTLHLAPCTHSSNHRYNMSAPIVRWGITRHGMEMDMRRESAGDRSAEAFPPPLARDSWELLRGS